MDASQPLFADSREVRRARGSVNASYRLLEEGRLRSRENGRWKEDRESSPVANLRAHHNWLKAGMIQAFVRPGDRVLDLCCGSGGDVRKFRMAEAKRWDGVDICDFRVEEAQRRCSSEESRSQSTFRATATRAPAEDVVLGRWRKTDYYDCVTCFFGLHYFWDPNRGIDLVRGLKRLLYRRKGTILAILPCSVEVESRFARSPTGFGNSIYRCEASGRPGEYRFWLADSVPPNTPERVLPIGALIREFGDAGFRCEVALRFEQLDDWLRKHPRSAPLADTMRPSKLSDEERQVSSLYVALVFVRS